MGVNSSKGFNFRLMASGSNGFTELDLFKDEIITVSDNVTGLFDIGVLPSDFTRQILVPGTKKNNYFFEHVYDIAVENPYLFETNVKVPAYFDFDGLYVSQGYLQLNKVNVYANRFVDSYEISIFGNLSSFARDINRLYITDLTASLAQYNHTSSLQNITSSWDGNLFGGDIVYPLAEYGQKILYTPEENQFGIDSVSGSLCVQDFKPAIRIKPVFDAIFETAGYTYSSSFMNQTFLDNVYMIANRQLRYPVYYSGSNGINAINLETYGLFRTAPYSGSGQTTVLLSPGSDLKLPWYKIESNPGGNLSTNLVYGLNFSSSLRGELQLDFEVTASGTPAGSGVPQFNLVVKNQTPTTVATIPLTNINNFMVDVKDYNNNTIRTEKFNLTTEFNTPMLGPGSYSYYLQYTKLGDTNFDVILNPNNAVNSYLAINKVNQGGDGLTMNIADNLPYATNGIKCVDFIKGIQKKYNLVIYPDKTQQRQFIIETFNEWYNKGETKDFNKYINLDEKIEVVPANNLAVNELNFGDRLDGDYVSQQFSKENNREFGKSYYVDTNNFFSQGQFNVETTFASSPLIYVSGTGASGSIAGQTIRAGFQSSAQITTTDPDGAAAYSQITFNSETVTYANAVTFGPGGASETDPVSQFRYRVVAVGSTIQFEAMGGGTTTDIGFYRINDSGTTLLATTSPYTYTVTAADVSNVILNFVSNINSY
jgi:hypothetical protein